MKKIFYIATLLILINANLERASAVECAVCFDPIIMDALTEAKTALSAGFDISEAIADSAFTAKYLVEISLDILANTAKHTAIENIANSVSSWATGGFQGDPTFPTNPGRFLENITKSETRLGLGELMEGEDILSGDVIDSVVKNFRQEQGNVQEKTSFTLGSVAQNSICDDANLSEMAKKAVGGVLNGPSYTAKKAELANSLCSGDASKDKNTQQKLVDIYKSDFSGGGGWDSWLALTSNPKNTEYGNVMAAKVETTQVADEKVNDAKEELEQNNGYIGIKTCVKEVYLETEGITSCEEYETQTPGTLVSSKLADGIFGPARALGKAQGYRDVAMGLIDGVINGVVGGLLAKGLSGSAKSGTSVNSSNSYTLTSGSYVNTNKTYNPTIALTAQEKANSIDQIVKQLDADLNLIGFSRKINRQPYFDFITTYENNLNTLETKYNTLTTEFPLYKTRAMITYGTLYIKNQRTEIAEFRNTLTSDVSNLDKAESIISATKARLNRATTTWEIQAAYKEYTDAVTGKLIPSNVSSAEQIDKMYQNTKSELERDLTQNMTNNITQCQAAIDLERLKKACLANGKYYEWIGYCYYNARRECGDKGGYWAWNGTTCVDTSPSQSTSIN